MRKTLLALLFLFVAILEIGALTPTLTYYGILDKGKEISIPLAWKTQSLVDSSSDYDDTLAKAAVCLARSIYVSEEAVKRNLLELGFTSTWVLDEEDVSNPVVAFSHQKKLGIHYYAIVVRGTASLLDWITDFKALHDYFVEAGDETMEEFRTYCSTVLGKTEEDLKKEENVFFVVGHSLGAAVANHLSQLLSVYTDETKIFTYTFESPSTGVTEENDALSYAINVINKDDFIPDVPFPQGRFGRDVLYVPEELDPEIYKEITGKKLGTIEGFTIFNHFDNHLLDCSLTYVLTRAEGKLRSVED